VNLTGYRNVLIGIFLAGANGCSPPATRAERPPAMRGESRPATGAELQLQPPQPRAATVAAGTTRALEIPGFLPAVLFVPQGRDARPLVVAAHGAGGAPEWECEYWRRLTADERFVLCLRGTSLGKSGGYYYRNEHALEAELVAAERAARAEEPRISPHAGLYAGFSQGASMGSAMIARHGGAFPSLALIEGYEGWNIARARSFARSGGQRILFACGTSACNARATDSARWLEKGGVEARVEYAAGAGHTPLAGVMVRVEQALPWLLGDGG
jgi:predicted esterase